MNKLVLCLLLLSPLAAMTQKKNNSRPKLVIGIVVDQMRPDYLQRYWSKLGENGFKKIVDGGFTCRNTHFNYAPTYTAPGHASIYTGTTPSVHGIAGNDWYDRKEGQAVYCTWDSTVTGVGSNGREGRMSPSRLLTTTITDQLQLCTRMQSRVIGISLKDRGAILPAGRSADAAYWYDGVTGNWISSSWYMKELPQWVKEFNDRRWPDFYLSKPWTTLLPIEAYTECDKDDNPYEAVFKGEKKPIFPHDLPGLRGSSFDLVRRTPFGNTMTKDLALAAIAGEALGLDTVTDFLCISFSATDYVGHQFGPNAIETADTYLRLDKDLATLLDYLDKNIGKDEYLLFLTADHACAENPKHLIDLKLPGGFVNDDTVTTAIREYLASTYRKDGYLLRYINDQVFLDTERMKADGINVQQAEEELGEHLRNKLDGMYDYLCGNLLQKGSYTGQFRGAVQRGWYPGRSGDVWMMQLPGWTSRLYSGDGTQGTTHGSPYPYDTHAPLHWYGWKIPQGSSADYVAITDIAPTLAFLLDITLPSGCTCNKIDALLK